MSDRPLVTSYDGSRINWDADSLEQFKLAGVNNYYTGCMNIETGMVYLGPLAAFAKYPLGKPREGIHKCAGSEITPITHGQNSMTSHHQIASHVLTGDKFGAAEETEMVKFCGFSLRFQGDHSLEVSPTSGTLNLNTGGQGRALEPALLDPLCAFLQTQATKHKGAGWTVVKDEVRTQKKVSPVALLMAQNFKDKLPDRGT